MEEVPSVRVGYVHSVSPILCTSFVRVFQCVFFHTTTKKVIPSPTVCFFYISLITIQKAPLLNPATSLAISAVDVEKEVEALRNVFKESGQKIRFRQEVATVPNFGNLLAKGCYLLHYTGHVRKSIEQKSYIYI
jgi:hypothetical protein